MLSIKNNIPIRIIAPNVEVKVAYVCQMVDGDIVKIAEEQESAKNKNRRKLSGKLIAFAFIFKI